MVKSGSWPKLRSLAAAVVGAAVIATILGQSLFELLEPYTHGASEPAHRALKTNGGNEEDAELYPWARDNLRHLSAGPGDPSKENFLFWHIHKSGGTAAKELYKCAGKIIDVQSQAPEILRAKEAGLVHSGIVDIVFSSRPDVALKHLYDRENQATVLAIFRHPVDRLVSKFYYLQVAHWEKTYSPAWKNMNILKWAERGNADNEHMVKTLAGKGKRDKATEAELLTAKNTIRQKFTVGLMDRMEESIRRFNRVMGMSESDTRTRGCMAAYFGKYATKKNSNIYPKVEEGSVVWKALAEKNKLDIQLYEYVVELFDDQRELVDSYAGSANRAEA